MVHFGKEKEKKEKESPKRRRPPPDYLSRNVQYRLMMLVGLLMLVILLMERARDPKVWAWMFADEKGTTKTGEAPPSNLDAKGKDPHLASPLAPLSSDGKVDRMWSAKVKSWSDVLKVVTRSDQVAIHRFLKHLRDQSPTEKQGDRPVKASLPKSTSEPRWRSMIRQLDQRWTNYLQEVDQSLLQNQQMDKQLKAEWVQIVGKLELQWVNEIKPALQAPLKGEKWSKTQQVAMQDLQRVLDYLDLQQVQDFTIGFRHRELVSWNRLWEVLRETPQAELQKASLGQAQYLQLFRQPEQYRGKLIRIQGTARAGYKSRRGIYVLGVQLDDGPPDPVLVYALELPKGFPEIADSNDQFNPLKFAEPITVFGYFFKCLRYATEKGTSAAEAPLVMAKTFNWKERPEFSIQAEKPKTPTLILGITGVSIFAIAFAWFAWRMSQSPKRKEEQSDLSSLANEDISTVSESLEALEQNHDS